MESCSDDNSTERKQVFGQIVVVVTPGVGSIRLWHLMHWVCKFGGGPPVLIGAGGSRWGEMGCGGTRANVLLFVDGNCLMPGEVLG